MYRDLCTVILAWNVKKVLTNLRITMEKVGCQLSDNGRLQKSVLNHYQAKYLCTIKPIIGPRYHGFTLPKPRHRPCSMENSAIVRLNSRIPHISIGDWGCFPAWGVCQNLHFGRSGCIPFQPARLHVGPNTESAKKFTIPTKRPGNG